MKQIVINKNNLSDDEVEFGVIRVKALIINEAKEILLEHNNGTYQLPGGHNEDNESLEETLTREILEETGIEEKINMGPFVQITTYDSNYFNTCRKVKNRIYYYALFTNKEPDISKTHYDELECQTPFNLVYVKVNEIYEFLNEAVKNGDIESTIAEELKLVFDEYNRIYN